MHLGFDPDDDLLIQLGLNADGRRSPFDYPCMPFEFVPFGWAGSDALQYGHLMHAPERGEGDFPVGSFSPADDSGVWWLGNDTRDAIQNFLSANLRIAAEDPEWVGSVDDYVGDRSLVTLCAKLGFQLEPAADNVITHGGRSQRRIVPAVPEGWHFEPTPNGVGVLAPETSFDFSLSHLKYDYQSDLNPFLDRARVHLERRHPASALRQLYEVHGAASLEGNRGAIALMKDAYQSLGRPFLVSRVETYLRRFSKFRE